MHFDGAHILAVLDRCCDRFAFPMLDNGYVYLAATRLSLYRSETDWAMVIEVFGFSPRAGLPDTHVQTFASTLYRRDPPEQYVSSDAFASYLATHPHDEYRSVFPVSEGDWQDSEDGEFTSQDASEVVVRGQSLSLPRAEEYARHGIELTQPPRVRVFELCRYLADVARGQVLAAPQERRVSVLPELTQLLQLEEWHHPNLVDDERPSGSETFQQLAEVLVTGDVERYRPSQRPNTHWRNWPEGGTL